MSLKGDLREVLATTGRVLTFRPAIPDLQRLGPLYLAVGLALAGIAGIGRHLDNPKLPLWQRLGSDSVIYVFVFAAILWLVLWPMRPHNWRYVTILVFVALTAPPAFLYAIPAVLGPDGLAAWFGGAPILGAAQVPAIKVWLLLIVSIWRVALLVVFLHGAAGLRGFTLLVAVLTPLVLIVASLTLLNLDQAVFNVMGGRGERTVNDGAYAVLAVLTFVSVNAFPLLLIFYIAICVKRRNERRRMSSGGRAFLSR
jgi:hypothetical protein